MRSLQIFPIVIAAALYACVQEAETLNSERIEQQFGSYGIEVLSPDAGIRRSNLYSLHDGQRICRTYAVVRFVDDLAPEIAQAHADVVAGQSIGSTFKSGGWQINKQTIYIGSLVLDDPAHPIGVLMALREPAELGVHAYRFILQRDDQSIDYAMIVETHHPDYLSTGDLQSLYGDAIKSDLGTEEVRNLSTLIMDMD
ncbi:MAG: hypothetical protein ACR2QS_16810 [Woeseiaceae bacterium]